MRPSSTMLVDENKEQESPMSPDHNTVRPLVALATSKPKVEIGKRWTGRREYFWDSRAGVYSEALPVMGYDEWLVMHALVPTMLCRRRTATDVRQPPFNPSPTIRNVYED